MMDGHPHDRSLDVVVGRILRVGVLSAAAVIAAGLVWLTAAGPDMMPLIEQLHAAAPGAPAAPPTLGGPFVVIHIGILLLVATPVLRIVGAGTFFALQGERGYALVSLVLLLLLALGFALGKGV